ncbi:imelysin family protein [Tamlana sp. 2_MG-2023]|uniref:imelysin family protein n=1 Tax=unclassified Tamlana TaxID=2614803 RepID=UPI0026E381D2|nr:MULTISPECIES: imelysin family protein [unclassified Tamlana]MDO6758807.1 imelysin family protein [Tamlana sp. 2_MG-2023]MDO6789506.1 imelysin family protein [Tamlana sp. 1_MG-2023]
MFTLRKVFLALTIVILFNACSSSSSDDNPTSGTDSYDRGELLVNLADNIIIPAFQDLNSKLKTLQTDKDNFIAIPDQTNLETLRGSWFAAYKVWQSVEMFNIGKAESLLYGSQMNVYPTSIQEVEANITNGSYDLAHPHNIDAVGFPAVDYLLYGVAVDDAAIVTKYTDAKYQTYLSDVIDQMQALTEIVLNDWTSSYRDTFVSETGNTATSALNKMTNDYVFYFEKGLRANKIGIPAGNFSSTPLPDTVEGLYSKIYSQELAEDALSASLDVFNGKPYASTTIGESFKTYLEFLDRNDLVSKITTQFSDAKTKLNGLNANFYDQINTDNTKMTEAYDALQLIVVSLKVDMLQAFDVSVDYVDADGD